MFEPLFSLLVTLLSLSQPIPQKIAIRIFPHLHDYAPEGLDADPGQVRLKSASSCEIYSGDPHSAAPSGTLQSSPGSLDLSVTSTSLAGPLWIQCAGPITVLRQGAKTNYAYGGPIYVHEIATGPELIEVKALNDYLKGVVPSEMPASWPDEALQAQALAARTYAVFHMLLAREDADLIGQHPFYDVDDTVLYQAYTGNLDRTTASDQAVDETGSQILTYQGQIIQAYFSADAGGYTEEADHVWYGVVAPYCQSEPEPFEDTGLDGGRWGPWTVTLPLSEVNQRLREAGIVPGSSPVTSIWIDPGNVYVSGRASRVSVGLADSTVMEVDALAFQHALGLRSTLITMSLDPDTNRLEIDGRGFGHGVGMSQYGARLAALNGWTHSDILNFYYTDVDLCEIAADGSVSCPSAAPPPSL